MNATDISYAAGVVDSDGTIGIHKAQNRDHRSVSYRPRITVKQVTADAVDLLQDLWPAHRWVAKPQAEGRRPLQVWTIHSRAAAAAASDLLPYLRIKRKQAENLVAASQILRTSQARHIPPPAVVEGEPMISLADAAQMVGLTFYSAYGCVRNASVPFVRLPRKGRPRSAPAILIPESFIETWAARGRPTREESVSDELEKLYLEAKRLNTVGLSTR